MSTAIYSRRSYRGFTIVELLIVIVVIAVLAAISVVAFAGIQERARDTQRKSDLANLAKAIKLYQIDNGDYAEKNCGNGTGSGWLHSGYSGPPTRPIYTCLISAGVLDKPLVDPSGLNSCSNGADCHAYMKASCSAGTWVMANLEGLPQNEAFADDKCSGLYASWDTAYGINYAVRVD